MEASEIRGHSFVYENEGQAAIGGMLQEIAAQLAEQKEIMAMLYEELANWRRNR
jgi:hypothetical protein